MAITFPTVFQSSITTDPAATAAGYLTPTRYNSGCAPAGLGTNQLLYSTGATALAQSANLTYSETNGPQLTVGSGGTTSAGWVLGYGGTSGASYIWATASGAPSGSNYSLLTFNTETYLNGPSGALKLMSSNNLIMLLQSTLVTISSGVNLKLGTAYVAGATTATGTIAIQDNTGTTYNVLVHT